MRFLIALVLMASPALAADPHFFQDKYGRTVFTADGEFYFVVCADKTICIKAHADNDADALKNIEAVSPPTNPIPPLPRGGR